jgi:hypothetical protein
LTRFSASETPEKNYQDKTNDPNIQYSLHSTTGNERESATRRARCLVSILQQPRHLENLQYRDLKAGFERRRGTTIHNRPRVTQTDDYGHAGALVVELDSVLAASTSVVHLAGALGHAPVSMRLCSYSPCSAARLNAG